MKYSWSPQPPALEWAIFHAAFSLHVQFTHFQLASRPTRPWCSSQQVQPQDSETRKGMLTAEYVPCFHKLYKSTCALCGQPQLPLPRRVCPGEGRVCFRTLCTPDPGGGDRRFKIYEYWRVIWKLCPNRLPCIPAGGQSLRRQGSSWSIFVSFLVIKG